MEVELASVHFKDSENGHRFETNKQSNLLPL